ncbi:MAG: hypothetical protein R6W75_09465 [Smithellaceae bacterium]
MLRNFGDVRQFFMVLVAFGLLFSFPAPSAHATPPEKIELKYNYASQTLLVIITHESKRSNHYIKLVEINKNGSIVSMSPYDSQPSGNTFTYVYPIPALDDDTFEAIVTCSQGDSKTSDVFTVRQ